MFEWRDWKTLPYCPHLSNKPLEEILRSLISSSDNIDPEIITVDYIMKRREKAIYPSALFNLGSRLGGYNTKGLVFFTRNDFDELEARVDAALKHL